jgi:hypothetical protein
MPRAGRTKSFGILAFVFKPTLTARTWRMLAI